MKTDYNQQAEKFARKYGVKFHYERDGYGPYFDDDERNARSRAIYSCVLIRAKPGARLGTVHYEVAGGRVRLHTDRGARMYSFKIGASIVDTEAGRAPSLYDVLACLTKYEPPASLEDFAEEYGYEMGTRSERETARRTYKAVKAEWAAVLRLFGEDGQDRGECLEALREIN